MESKFIEYLGFVPLFEEDRGYLVKIACKEIDFELKGFNLNYSFAISKFKEAVDNYLSKKEFSYEESEKELNRFKELLLKQPEVFYETQQVYFLITLAEDLLAASKKEQKIDFNMKEYYKRLDQLLHRDRILKYHAKDLQQQLIEIKTLFQGVLDFSLNDIKRDYFELANKE